MMRLSRCWRGLRKQVLSKQLEAMHGDGWRRRDCSEGAGVCPHLDRWTGEAPPFLPS